MIADVPTLLLMTVVSSVVVAGALLVLGEGNRRDGLQHWAWALLLGGAGYGLFLLRGRIPDALSVVLANAILSGMISGLIAAVRCFHGLAPGWPQLLVAPVTMAALMALFLDSFPMRILLSNTLMGTQVVWLLWTLHTQGTGPLGKGARLLTSGLVLEATMLFVRSVSGAAFAGQDASIFLGNTVQTLTFMVAFIALLVTSMGFLFMGKDRADAVNRRLAAQDELTGAANRRAIIAALERDMAHAVRMREPMALMMVDVDHFKKVNDHWGHPAGDAVLRHVVAVLRQRVRVQDVVGRYGGEEFLLVLPGTEAEGAYQLAQQLCAAVQDTPCPWGQEAIAVTVSIGVFGGRLQPQDHWGLLLHAADQALYRAKETGRNRAELVCGLEPVLRPASGLGAAATLLPSL